MGGDPTQISFTTKQTGNSLCLTVSQSHPLPVDTWTSDSKISNRNRTRPVLSLKCPVATQVISSIKFASFGTPKGTCGSFSNGQCNSSRSLSVVQKVLILFFFLLTFHFLNFIYTWSVKRGRHVLDRGVATLKSRLECSGNLVVASWRAWLLKLLVHERPVPLPPQIWYLMKYVIVEKWK